MKIVEQFKLKKKMLGGYKVAYQCPYCRESLSSQEHEIIEEEECPECGGVFRVADSALSMIESLENQNKSKKNVVSVKQPTKTKNDDVDESQAGGATSSHALNFKNDVPSGHVYELDASFDGRSINVALEIIIRGRYLIAGGQVGDPSPSGHDTFRSGYFDTKTISGASGDIISVSIPVRLHNGNWAVGIFEKYSDIETSHVAKSVSSPTDFSEIIAPVSIAIIAVLFVASIVLQTMSGSSSSYSSPATSPTYNSSGYNSSSSDLDTSGFSRKISPSTLEREEMSEKFQTAYDLQQDNESWKRQHNVSSSEWRQALIEVSRGVPLSQEISYDDVRRHILRSR